MKPTQLVGIDLAWQGEKNPSALAFGTLYQNRLTVKAIEPAVIGLSNIRDILQKYPAVTGIAVDASLIIPNQNGQRECEAELNHHYRKKYAACHPTNRTLYPDPFSVKLSNILLQQGFDHLGSSKWQIECYPHPALIEIFGLSERLKYKKGTVAERRKGQLEFARYLNDLAFSPVIKLNITDAFHHLLSEDYIARLKGQSLKTNEDALDAIVCLYIAALYKIQAPGRTFGSPQNGYIWVPRHLCLS